MFKITNNATTYIAIANVNLAPRQFTTVPVITESLHYLEHRGAIKIETLVEVPKPVVRPVVSSTTFIPRFKKEKK